MSRPPLNYSNPGQELAVGGFDPDTPIEGYYRLRLARGAVWSAVRIWHGPPLDPDTGEEMDRSWRWQATINGALVEIDRVWPRCAADRIDQREHDYLIRIQAVIDPGRRVDPLTAPLPF